MLHAGASPTVDSSAGVPHATGLHCGTFGATALPSAATHAARAAAAVVHCAAMLLAAVATPHSEG